MKYIKQLDTLRAVAVLFVIVGHWTRKDHGPNMFFYLADAGVNIFYVLSGFLITWILLVNREQAASEKKGLNVVLKNFYIRRTLRIFPIYYLCIIFFYFSPTGIVENTNDIFPWLFTYTSNLYFFIFQKWDGYISHLWSLAVEEQFYLIWPSIMLFVKRKYLLHTILAFLLIGVFVQFFYRGVPYMNYFTVTCFSSFGMGGVLAWVLVYKPDYLKKLSFALRVPAFVSLLVFLYSTIQGKGEVLPMQRIFHSVIALYLITYIVKSSIEGGGHLKWFWNNKVLIFIGKISYGLYLYHGFLPRLVSDKLITYFNFNPETYFSFGVYFALKLIMVVLVSWLSWIIIEKPILGFKKYFEYGKTSTKLQTTIQ